MATVGLSSGHNGHLRLLCKVTLLTLDNILQVKGEKPPAPTLGLAAKGGHNDEEGGDAEDGGGGGEDHDTPAVNLADLVPRNDIR